MEFYKNFTCINLWRCNWRFKGLSDFVCLENVIYITKQEKVSIYYLGPFLGEFVRAKRKPNFSAMWLVREKNRREKGSVPTLLLVASREQIRPLENVILVIILLPVKYLLKLSGSRNFYRLRMTSLTSTNVFTISCLSIEPNPPPRASVNLFLQHGAKPCKVSIALFVDYSYYSSTIRGLFVLFADYSYYSSTIRFTILVLSIALTAGW
jgi:hypothetical protein